MKEKIKKLAKKIMFAITLFVTTTGIANAQSNVYYTNNNGVQMTEEQYNFLLNFYDVNQISVMTQKRFDIKINSYDHSSTTFYSVDTVVYDNNGNVLNVFSTQVDSEEEAIEMMEHQNSITPRASNSYQTSSKKITLTVQKTSVNGKSRICISTDVEWLNNSVPAIKSFDVLAHRFTTSGSLFLNAIDGEGWQDYNTFGNVTYGFLGNNSVKYSNGYGISMNIVDDATRNLTLASDILYEYSGTGTINAYGTYQHAITDVTLAQSQSYTFASGGLGNVLNFSNSTIRGYYDGMGGTSVTYAVN